MTKVSDQRFKLYVHHRHRALARDLQNAFDTTRPDGTPLNKIAILEGRTFNVYIESLDGLCDDVPAESCGYPVYAHRWAPGKPFAYVKVNHSPTVGSEVEKAVSDLGGTFIRGTPVSYYDVFGYIDANRKSLRGFRESSGRIEFMGKSYAAFSYDTSRHDVDVDGRTWSMTAEHATMFGAPGLARRDIAVESRAQTVSDMVARGWITSDQVSPTEYVGRVLKSGACFQPNGIGPRASIIECLALGVPSLVEKNSYVHPALLERMPVYDPKNPKDPREHVYPTFEHCVHLYETQFAPGRIVADLANRIERLL